MPLYSLIKLANSTTQHLQLQPMVRKEILFCSHKTRLIIGLKGEKTDGRWKDQAAYANLVFN